MKNYILTLFLIIFVCINQGNSQHAIQLFTTPTISDFHYSANNSSQFEFIKELEKPLFSLGYGLNYSYNFKKLSLGLEVKRLNFGMTIPKKELTAFEQIEYTHFSERTVFTTWCTTLKGGYRFLRKDKWNLGINVGLGVNYLSKINYQVHLYVDENTVETATYNELSTIVRAWNYTGSVELPFNYKIGKDIGIAITPHLNYWLLDIFPETTARRNPFLFGCNLGFYKEF